MNKSPEPRHGNVRLSLETKPSVKQAILDHGKELGEWSIVGCIRRAVSRSAAIFKLEQRGTLLLQRHSDGEIEDVKLPAKAAQSKSS